MANLVQIVLAYEDVYDVLKAHTDKINEDEPTESEMDDIMDMALLREGNMTYFELKYTLEDIRTNNPDND